MTELTRRNLLGMIGTVAGSTAMYYAMTSMGHAQPSSYKGPIKLDGDPKGAKVLILGAGLAGMTAALEMRAAGYEVEILEYREKAGGRCWTLRGGDTYTELGGATQNVDFEEGNYINPGPWRIPHHHYALLDYCRRLKVPLEVFVQKNFNAYVHNEDSFDGKPQRLRDIEIDYRGHTSELLAKAVDQGKLDEMVSEDDREMLLESLRELGVLNGKYEYTKSLEVSDYRGYEKPPGGGMNAAPVASTPIDLDKIVQSRLWEYLSTNYLQEHQNTMFQPVGGMDAIAKGFEREVGDLITYNAKVTSLQQDDNGVTVQWEDARGGGETRTSTADWCVCTIPFSVLNQIDHNLSGGLATAIGTMFYNSSVKWGLEFKRRFWEQDENIYGGISYTDQAIAQISYPSYGYQSDGPAVLLGGYTWRGSNSYKFNAMSPDERIEWALKMGEKIHPQYREEFKTGVTVSWHKVPWTLGCSGVWEGREGYDEAVKIDNRVVCAGEHLSYLPAWQEGAILSSLDAISRLHDKVING
ncbi:flavin monoamine oxidase family protein [Jannaschia rubra]|uniref:Tryptophan 2-monooxygenase n=1 Tax=Jannaschia rubra TaxID=282197 RepID=A0A0M6XTE3_9RHOB|nr:flavin monoamine oxidase family protein [Jannaschia rubra]CTQ33982.1 protoporphyrinogen oxidase [Jannaschia rubra]SFG25916.1 monoamine oxidase [Jannaschia rubra]